MNNNLTEEFIEKFGNYWYCSLVDTWVPLGIRKIQSKDQVNHYFYLSFDYSQTKQNVCETLVGGNKPILSIDEYHEKYCYFENNKWIWRKENIINA